MKVTVVGAGAVGASCAEYIAIKNFASAVVLVDFKENFDVRLTFNCLLYKTLITSTQHKNNNKTKQPQNS